MNNQLLLIGGEGVGYNYFFGLGDRYDYEINGVPHPRLVPSESARLIEVMRKIAEIHKTMNPKPGRSAVEIVREGREGAMYG